MSSDTSSTARTSPEARAPNIDSPNGKTFVRLRISTSGISVCKRERPARAQRSNSTSATLALTRSESRVHRRRLAGNQLAQNELQDAAIGVVLCRLRSVDTYERVELFLARTDFYLPSRGKLPDQLIDAGNLKDFFARKIQRLRALSRQKLQRQNSHAHQVGAMNAL